MHIPTKPAAPDPITSRRWQETSRRHRMLTGNWADDLENELMKHINSERRAAWGVADMSSNVFKSIVTGLSALYSEHPAIGVVNAPPMAADPMLKKDGLIDRAGLWQMMQHMQVFTLGLNDMFLRVDLNDTGTGLFYRPVYPDMVYATAPAGDPTNPNLLIEYRLRGDEEQTEEKDIVWTADIYDIRDVSNPKYMVFTVNPSGKMEKDVTRKYLGSDLSGNAYPYRDKSGAPFLPFSTYHAESTGRLFSPFVNAEIVAGSLSASVCYTLFLHTYRDCSFPQRYIMGLNLAGTGIYDTDTSARRAAISTDPASILCFTVDPDVQGVAQPMIGQWQAGGDPLQMLEALTIYERRLAVYMGINPADIVKQSGDPRSGFAISLSQQAKRDAQRTYAPIFRYSDIKTLELSAMVANRFLGLNLPESGYRIAYQAVPLSPEELRAQRDDILAKLQAGLIGPIEAIMQLHPDFDQKEASEYLNKIRREKLEYGFVV